VLKIRSEHMSALAGQQTQGFVRRMTTHLREIFPEEVAFLDDERLKAFVETVCAKAEKWGIVEEPHVERLIELFVSFEQLRRDPAPGWIAYVVTYPGRSGEHKLQRLEGALVFGEGE
jgi:hypothetical protein